MYTDTVLSRFKPFQRSTQCTSRSEEFLPLTLGFYLQTCSTHVVSPLLFNLHVSSQLIRGGPYLSRWAYFKDRFINVQLHFNFCSSPLHYLQFYNVRFLVMTPYLCLVFQPWHIPGFMQPQYCIIVSGDYC